MAKPPTQLKKSKEKLSNDMREKLLIVRMLLYTKDVEGSSKPIKKKQFTSSQGNEFLMSVIFDRNIKWESAWKAGKNFVNKLEDKEDSKKLWMEVIKMKGHKLDHFIRNGNDGKAFHRYWKTFSRLLPETASYMLEKHEGDARNIWENIKDPKVIEYRFDEIPLIGPALAKMAVILLVKNYGIITEKKAYRKLDVKPDIHVTRVFKRSGIVNINGTIEDVLEAARGWSPDDPSLLDTAAWNIGLNWCHATSPECQKCLIGSYCLKIIKIK